MVALNQTNRDKTPACDT